MKAYCEAAAAQERPGPHRAGQRKDGRLHRLVCDQSRQRPADSDLDRRLRADQLWHRRDHGRAGPRRARLRVRQRSFGLADSSRSSIPATTRSPANRAQSKCWPGKRCFAGEGMAINSGNYDGLTTAEFKEQITSRSGEARPRPRRPSTTSSATGSFRGSGSGASRFRSCTSSTPPASRPAASARSTRRTCRSICRTWTTSSPTAGPSRRSTKRPTIGSTP